MNPMYYAKYYFVTLLLQLYVYTHACVYVYQTAMKATVLKNGPHIQT